MHVERRFVRAASVVLGSAVFVGAGCAPDGLDVMQGDGAEEGAAHSLPIFGGEPATEPFHGAVVSLHRVANGSLYVSPFCSGTLIAPNVVLTAAHCLDVASPYAKKFSTMSPSSLAVFVGDQPTVSNILSHIYTVSKTLIHPSYDRLALRNDIALVKLSQPVTEPVAPVPSLPASLALTQADVGDLMNFAGFGLTESGTSGVKLAIDLPLGGLGCAVPGCGGSGDPATQVSYAQPGGGPCSGDSGGPMFVFRNGAAYVGGVTSYGDAYCTVYGVSTRADAYESWIAAFVGPNCSADGTCNAQCAPGADPDCGGVCGDGVCGQGESCDGRNGTKSCKKDCPGVTTGKASQKYCYVNGSCQGPGCP